MGVFFYVKLRRLAVEEVIHEMSKKKMTLKQQRFADEYIRVGELFAAYRNAGYSFKSESSGRAAASRLLTNVNVRSYIDARLEELKKESIAEQDEVLQYLTSVMRGEKQDEELMLVPVGDFESEVQRHERRSDTTQRTKAAELLGKRYAMWTDKQEVEHKGLEIEIDYGDNDDDEG